MPTPSSLVRSFSGPRLSGTNQHQPLLHSGLQSGLRLSKTRCTGSGGSLHVVHAARRSFHPRCRNQESAAIGADLGPDARVLEAQRGLLTPRESDIRIIDYSADHIVQQQSTSRALPGFLQDHGKPEWATCRWIYVNGLNDTVVKTLVETQGLHWLTIEDVLHTGTPTKVDWYSDHCFVVMTLQKLVDLRQHRQETDARNELTRDQNDGDGNVRWPAVWQTFDRRDDGLDERWPMLSQREHTVSVEQVSAFLTTNNTVITLFSHSGPDILTPLLTRLQSSRTMLRSTNDASMLIQAVIDTIIDLSLPISKDLSAAFRAIEHSVLTDPTLAQSNQLYALRSELTRFRDLVMPLAAVVRMLRDHDASLPLKLAVTHFLPNSSDSASSSTGAASSVTSPGNTGFAPERQVHPRPAEAKPLISPLTRTYLSDVQDHLTVLSTSTSASIRSAENLTSLMFNTITARQNESVRQLTFVSIFFLPLTFLTAYFGMNFETMPLVQGNSDAVFWYIATPVMLAILVGMRARTMWARSGKWWRRRGLRGRGRKV